MSLLVDAAIKRSREQDEIVHVTKIELLQARLHPVTIHNELFEACEGEVENGSEHEYWGHGTDGPNDSPWRVHIPARSFLPKFRTWGHI